MVRALYPGTFDPITNGHLDIIERASHIVDHLVVAIAKRHGKDTMFPLATRKRLVQDTVAGIPSVEVIALPGLLAEEIRKRDIDMVIRGLRAVSDFEYEMMMALMNRKLYRKFETVFLMPSARYVYLHSSLVREVHSLGGDVSDLVPEPVWKALQRREKKKKR
jgi:pantetheine-phosphate adenylyltransferase